MGALVSSRPQRNAVRTAFGSTIALYDAPKTLQAISKRLSCRHANQRTRDNLQTNRVSSVRLPYRSWLSAGQGQEQFPPATQWVKDNMQLTLSDQQGILLLIGVVFGFIILFLFWLAGTIVSAVGQILKAILDTAVNTSPFLSPEEKQRIIPRPVGWGHAPPSQLSTTHNPG
jgi:hypothetical protein